MEEELARKEEKEKAVVDAFVLQHEEYNENIYPNIVDRYKKFIPLHGNILVRTKAEVLRYGDSGLFKSPQVMVHSKRTGGKMDNAPGSRMYVSDPYPFETKGVVVAMDPKLKEGNYAVSFDLGDIVYFKEQDIRSQEKYNRLTPEPPNLFYLPEDIDYYNNPTSDAYGYHLIPSSRIIGKNDAPKKAKSKRTGKTKRETVNKEDTGS